MMKGLNLSRLLAGLSALLLLHTTCAAIPEEYFDALSGCSKDPLQSLLDDEYDEMSNDFQNGLESFEESGDTEDLEDITDAQWAALTSALGICINDELIGNLAYGPVASILEDSDELNDQARTNIIQQTDDDEFESVVDTVLEVTELTSSYPISCAMLAKSVEVWGEVSSWSDSVFSVLGSFTACMSYNSIEDLNEDDSNADDMLEVVFDAVNELSILNRLVCTALVTKASSIFGDDPGDWSSKELKIIGDHLTCLSPGTLALLSMNALNTINEELNLISFEPVQTVELIDKLQSATADETSLLTSIEDFIQYMTIEQFENYETGDLDNSEATVVCANSYNPGILRDLADYVKVEEDWSSLGSFSRNDFDVAGPIAYSFTPAQLSLMGTTGLVKSEISDFTGCIKNLNLRQKHQIVESYNNDRSDPDDEFTAAELEDLAGLLSAVSYSDLDEIAAEDMETSIAYVQTAAEDMTPVQLTVVLDKVRAAVSYDLNDALADLGVYIASQIPYKYLLNVTAIDLGLTIDEDTGLITADANDITTMDWSETLAYYLYSLYREDVSSTVALTPMAISTLGTLARGITDDDLDDVEVYDVLSSVYAITTQAGGEISPYLASLLADIVRSAVKDLYDSNSFNLGMMSDTELSFLPSDVLVQFTMDEMDDLSEESCVNITSWIGSNTRLGKITRKYKRQEIVEYYLKECIDSSEYSTEVLNTLGNLVCDIPSTKMSKIDTDTLSTYLYLFRDCCFDSDQGSEFLELIDEAIGDTSDFTSANIYSLGSSIFYFMDEDDINFSDDALMAVTDVLRQDDGTKEESQYCELELDTGEIKTRDSLKDAIATKVMDYVIDEGSKRKKRATSDLTCAMVEQVGAVYGSTWSSSDFTDMSTDELELCSEYFGTMDRLSEDVEEDLLGYVLEAWGGIDNCSNYQMGSLGKLAHSLDSSDINEFDFTDLDLVSRMSVVDGWTDSQYKLYYDHFLDDNDMTEDDLKSIHLKALGSFLCGIDDNQIEDITSFQYGLAANVIGNVTCFDQDQLDEFRALASSNNAFGDESEWDRMILHEIGTVAAGLSGELLGEISNDDIIGITVDAIKLFDPERLLFLSNSQIKSLTFEQASAIEESQQEYMTQSQQEALFTVVYMNGDEYPDDALLDTVTGKQSGVAGLMCSTLIIFISATLVKFL